MRCPHCGTEVQTENFCMVCGAPASGGSSCERCGTPYAGPAVCPHCGFGLSDGSASGDGAAQHLARGNRGRSGGRKWRRWVAGIGCLPGSLLLILLLYAVAEGNITTLLVASVAAIVPAAIYLWYAMSLDRYEKEPLRTVAFAFGWGAVGAVLFSLIAEAVLANFSIVAAGEDASSLFTLVIGAPVIEEAFKGTALLLLLRYYRDELDSVLDGLVYGAIIGFGFAMTENIAYFITAYQEEGASGLGELFVVRAVINGFGHAMYTGVTGAAIGWSRAQYQRGLGRLIVPVAGYLIAVVLHALWNGGVLAIAAAQGEDATIWSVMLVEVPLFVLPPLVILRIIARRGAESERAVLQAQLANEVANGVLTEDEFSELLDTKRRKEAMRAARRYGWRMWKAQRHFYVAAGDLAFRKHHLARGQQLHLDDRRLILKNRADIARFRNMLRNDTR